MALLRVEDLKTYFQTDAGLVKAVDGVSFTVNEQEIVGVVGESGCGKSVSWLSVMSLINPPGKIMGGKVLFEGKNLLEYTRHSPEMRAVRGAKISMIFQEPMTSLNPVLTVGEQVSEMLRWHLKMNDKEAKERTLYLMNLVGIPDAKNRYDDYPHQFSGGMRQRMMIVMAMSCNPRLVIADEPTTALDVTTQAQLLELLNEMVKEFQSSLVLITHNLGVVARYAHRIYVMYAGRVVEEGKAEDIFERPQHPYTIGLLKCTPRLDEEEGRELEPITGLPPNLINMPPTCAFLPRCKYRKERCAEEPWPPLFPVGPDHYARCLLHENAEGRVNMND
ncbi:MAG: ABC transporter ATP-binding protein [Firmicutes bacterium]|nr:ABC transporter ATP-binding protein [Bacillota bacterium]